MFYEILRFLLRTCLDLFYSRTSLGGRVPADGPVLLVANHPNALLDPCLVGLSTERQVRFLAKAPLLRMPVLGAIVRAVGALPVYRPSDSPGEQDKNDLTFSACYDALDAGSAICIFPEGISHSEPEMQRMKTGAARIVLGAEARRDFQLRVRIVPVGLTYREKHKFRGKVATWIGEPLTAPELKMEYAADSRSAVDSLTRRIGEALARVTLNVERWDDVPALEAAESIDAAEKGLVLDAAARESRLRAFADGLKRLRQHAPDKVEHLRSHIVAFQERLVAIGATPTDLDLRYTPRVIAAFVAKNVIRLVASPVVIFGALVFWIPYQFPRLAVALGKPDMDMVATYKVLASLLVFPIWYLLVVLAGGWFYGGWMAFLLAILLPVSGWCAIVFKERLEEALEDLAVFFRLGLRSAQKRHLLDRRAEIGRQIDELIAENEALASQPS